jgi:hypothetical protein
MDQGQTRVDPDFFGAILRGLLLKVERRVKPWATKLWATKLLDPTGSFAAPVAFELHGATRAASMHLIGLIADTHGLVRRFGLQPNVAILSIDGDRAEARLIPL